MMGLMAVVVRMGMMSGAVARQVNAVELVHKTAGGIANDRIEVTGVSRPITRAGGVSFSNLSSELSPTNPFGLAPVQAGTLETGVAGAAIGNFVGTTLGKYLVGDNIFAQVAVGSVLGTVLGAVGAGQFGALFGSGDGGTKAVESIANHLSADFGTQFANNVKTAGIGALSSFLTALSYPANDNAPDVFEIERLALAA